MKEIPSFDAKRYFADLDDRALTVLRSNDRHDEIPDGAKLDNSEGDLPLTPLSEIYMSGRARNGGTRPMRAPASRAELQRPEAPLSTRQTAEKIGATMSSRGGEKAHALSPSMRLSSFLSKFKLSSDSKAKAGQSTTPKPARASASSFTRQEPVTPPKGCMPSSSTSISPRVKTPSPRAGRFLLRALSSSSSQSNPLPKTIGPMQHRVTIAASTPVSPAGSDPYSPTTHSASTTPTSRRSMRSFHRSAYSPVSHSGTVEWRRSVEQSRNRSLSGHLPSIRRRIRAYLMPEKLHPNSKEYSHVLDETSAHERTIRRSEQHHPHHRKQQNIFDAIDIRLGDEKSGRQQAISPSPAHQGHPTHAVIQKLPSSTMTARDQQMQWRRKLEMWGRDERARRRAAREEAEEDDIEVAERLLRVVKEHQYTMSPHRSYTKPNHRSAQQQSSHHSRTPKRFQEGGESAGDGVRGNVLLENGINVSRKSKRNSISPSPFRGSSPARFPIHAHKTENTTNSTSKWNQDGDFAYAYDSDSSSDLFEIETLNAFTYVAAQYRPRDLPIYSTRSPLRHDA